MALQCVVTQYHEVKMHNRASTWWNLILTSNHMNGEKWEMNHQMNHVRKCCGWSPGWYCIWMGGWTKTTPLHPSLTQGAFIKAGFMQGGVWPLWGDPCTAGGLFWREQQDHMWPPRANRTGWLRNEVHKWSTTSMIPSIQQAHPYRSKNTSRRLRSSFIDTGTHTTIGVFIILY